MRYGSVTINDPAESLISRMVQSADPVDLAARVNAALTELYALADPAYQVVDLTLAGAGDGHTFMVEIEAARAADILEGGVSPQPIVSCYLAADATAVAAARLAVAPATGVLMDSQLAGAVKGTRFMGLLVNGIVTPPAPEPPPTQFVDLRTAGLFAIFAQSAITTTGGSTINGDMGINPAAAASITGFALVLDGGGMFSTSSQVFAGPLPQLGQVFAPDYAVPTPAKVVQASADMITAYNDAFGRAADSTSAGGDISADSPLTAGLVHRYTGASTVTAGPLTINGAATDGIIIQVQGTLDILDDIVLAGGILPENVYIVASGAITVAPGVTVNGQLLGAELIALQAGAVLNGRALAQTAVTLAGGPPNNIVVSPT